MSYWGVNTNKLLLRSNSIFPVIFMNIVSEIKFKKDDEKSDIQLKIIVFTIFISIIIFALIRTVGIALICGVIILIELIILGKKDGILGFMRKMVCLN